MRGRRRGLPLQLFPAEENPVRVVGRRGLDLLQALPEAARRPPAPAPARPKPPSAAPPARSTDACRGRSIGAISSQPGNGSPGGGRSRPGMPASRISSPNSASSAARFLVFGERQQRAVLDLQHRALRFHVEAADGFHLVAEQVDAHRLGRLPAKTRPGCRRAPSTRPPSPPARGAHSRCFPGAPTTSSSGNSSPTRSLSASCR